METCIRRARPPRRPPLPTCGEAAGVGRIVFGREAARTEQSRAGGDEERAVRPRERGAEGLNGAPVDRRVRVKLREVMDEGGVNHAVGCRGARAQAVQVLERPAMHLGPGSDERVGAGLRACQTEHLMARVNQFSNNGRTDEAGGSRDKDTHALFSFRSRLTGDWGREIDRPGRI